MSNEAERSSWEIVHELVEVDQPPDIRVNNGKEFVLYQEEKEKDPTKPQEKLGKIQKALGLDQNQESPCFAILSIPDPEPKRENDKIYLTITVEPPNKPSPGWVAGWCNYNSLEDYIKRSPSEAPSQGPPAKHLLEALIKTSKEICTRAHDHDYLLRYFEWDAFLLCTAPDPAKSLRIIYTGHRYACTIPERIGSNPGAPWFRPKPELNFKPDSSDGGGKWGFHKPRDDIATVWKSIQAAIKDSALTEDERRGLEEQLKKELPKDGLARVDPAPTSAPGDGSEASAAKTAKRPGNRPAKSTEPTRPAQAQPKAQPAASRKPRRHAIILGIGIAAGCIAFMPWTRPYKPEQDPQWPEDAFSMEYNGTAKKTIPTVQVVLKGWNGKRRTNTLEAKLTFNSKDAGNDKVVTWRLLQSTTNGPLGGATTSISGTNPGTIRPKRLEPKLPPLWKKYDGNRAFAVGTSNLEGKIQSDDVTVSDELTFEADDPGPGTNKTVSLKSKPNIKGKDRDNYSVKWPPQATATIVPRHLTFTNTPKLKERLASLTNLNATTDLARQEWKGHLLDVCSNDYHSIKLRVECISKTMGKRTFQVSLAGETRDNYLLEEPTFSVDDPIKVVPHPPTNPNPGSTNGEVKTPPPGKNGRDKPTLPTKPDDLSASVSNNPNNDVINSNQASGPEIQKIGISTNQNAVLLESIKQELDRFRVRGNELAEKKAEKWDIKKDTNLVEILTNISKLLKSWDGRNRWDGASSKHKERLDILAKNSWLEKLRYSGQFEETRGSAEAALEWLINNFDSQPSPSR